MLDKSQTKILLVDDELNFGSVLKDYLELDGYKVVLARDGEAGLSAFKKDKYDLCILDVMMPRMDGFTLGREIRKTDSKTPLIYLTAKTLKDDMLEGFKAGADDYITKPFDSEVLLYKIKAIIKRNETDEKIIPDAEYKIGQYVFNSKMRTISRAGEVQTLSPREADLLKMLCFYKNDIMPRSEALKRIWNEDNYFTTRSMDVFIAKLRKYLKDDPNIEIVNIHGNGYILKTVE